MSYCRKEGKDQIIFVTKDDYEKQTSQNPLLPEDEQPVGLIKENGEINWECPCLQGMADGPCGEPFKDAFACFHYSEAEPKGVDCLEQFKSMRECFLKHPEIYGSLDDDLKEEESAEGDTNKTSVLEGSDIEISEKVDFLKVNNDVDEKADDVKSIDNVDT